MGNNPFFHFLTLNLFAQRRRHLAVVGLSVLLIFLLASTLFISSSLQYSLRRALVSEPDFVVQRVRGEHLLPVPESWIDEIAALHGVDRVSARVWGRYYTRPKGQSFLIVGIDFLEDQSHEALAKLVERTDLRRFLSGHYMIAGEGAARWMRKHFYQKGYNFLAPDGKFIPLELYAELPKQSSLMGEDMIIVPIETARKILGLKPGESTDITFNVPNDDERPNIESKVSALHYDLRVISKKETRGAYDRLFNYKGGFFLVLFLIVLLAFALILYQRASQVYSSEKRSIGILRALGWSIRDVLALKLGESLTIVVSSFILGSVAAYFYVFALGAPLLRQIFLGGANLSAPIRLVPVIDFSILSSIFLLYGVSFIAAVLIPVWRIAVTDPKEAML
jgi:ABC-type lipoprotein release transport system permease subunit